MGTLEHSEGQSVALPGPASDRPVPFTPEPDEVPGAFLDAPIEPAPPTGRRTLNGKLLRRGRSQPIPVVDPWE